MHKNNSFTFWRNYHLPESCFLSFLQNFERISSRNEICLLFLRWVHSLIQSSKWILRMDSLLLKHWTFIWSSWCPKFQYFLLSLQLFILIEFWFQFFSILFQFTWRRTEYFCWCLCSSSWRFLIPKFLQYLHSKEC